MRSELPDLAALSIQRDEEVPPARRARVLIGIAILAVLVAASWTAYEIWLAPRLRPAAQTVVVKRPVTPANPAVLTATGYLVADRQAKITPKISGRIVRLNAEPGTRVARGDVLAVLESSALRAQLDDANALLRQSQRERDRDAALWNEGIVSRSVFDAAQAQLDSAKARAEQVRIDIADMVIRAPFAGTIATKNTEVGEVISSNTLGQVAGTLPAGAICTLVDLKTLKVVADVNETSLGEIREGQPAEVAVDAFPRRKWRGVLTEIIPTADRAKATVQVKVAIENPDVPLLPEMSASVSFLRAQ